MGSDIHFYLEYKNPNNSYPTSWTNFGYRYRPGRNYALFGLLAGVRGGGKPIVSPRGFPEDADYDTKRDFYYYINESGKDNWDNRSVSLKTAQNWGPIIYNKDGKPSHVQDPDAHTPTWLTYSEFFSALTLCENHHRKWLNSEDDETRKAVRELYAKDLGKYLIEYKAIVACMETLEKAGFITRVVFWFDN